MVLVRLRSSTLGCRALGYWSRCCAGMLECWCLTVMCRLVVCGSVNREMHSNETVWLLFDSSGYWSCSWSYVVVSGKLAVWMVGEDDRGGSSVVILARWLSVFSNLEAVLLTVEWSQWSVVEVRTSWICDGNEVELMLYDSGVVLRQEAVWWLYCGMKQFWRWLSFSGLSWFFLSFSGLSCLEEPMSQHFIDNAKFSMASASSNSCSSQSPSSSCLSCRWDLCLTNL